MGNYSQLGLLTTDKHNRNCFKCASSFSGSWHCILQSRHLQDTLPALVKGPQCLKNPRPDWSLGDWVETLNEDCTVM